MKLSGTKLFLPVLCLLIGVMPASGQFGDGSRVPYFRYALSGGGGITFLSGDLKNQVVGAGAFIRGDYFLIHGLSLGLEGQEGILRSEGTADNDTYPRVTMMFFTGMATVRFHPLQFIASDHDRRILYRKPYFRKVVNTAYVGAGFGVTSNFTRHTAEIDNKGTLYFSSLYHTAIGVDFPLNSTAPNSVDSYMWYINLNGQMNFAANKGMDRYNEKFDRYSLISVGLKLML